LNSSAAFDSGQRALLERIAGGAPLPDLLHELVQLLEAQAEGMLCSVLLVDERLGTVHPIAAPSLPREYTQALEGAPIGPEEGSCGAAAFRRERVIAADIATHRYWGSYKEIALSNGLRACWSSPIFSPDKQVLGTFAMYYREPREPTLPELAWIDAATHLAAIAIVRDRSEQSLRASEARYRKLARLYAVSSTVNEAIVRMREPQALYDFACHVVVDNGLARLAWIGLLDADEERLEPVARAGIDGGYVEHVAARLSDPHARGGPASRALSSRAAAVCRDIATDEGFYFRREALALGFRSCVVLPLVIRERVGGVLALYSDVPDGFHGEELQVLEALAADIGFAVESAENEAERRRVVQDLGERVKELTLIHGVAHILQQERPIDAALLASVIELCPSAFKFASACEARIVLGELEAKTPGFVACEPRIVETFGVADRAGRIEVAYVRPAPAPSSAEFLAEERQLLRSIADMLGAYLGRSEGAVALRKSEERLRAVIEHTPNVAIQGYDSEGRLLFANRASLRLFGWDAHSAIGKTLGELSFPPADAARFEAALAEVAATESAVGPLEFGFKHADGRDGTLLSTVFRIPLRDDASCFVCTDVDLTDYKRMEEAIRAGERLRALIYSAVSDVIFYLAVDPRGEYRFLSVNQSFLNATGLTEQLVVGRTLDEVVESPLGDRARAKLAEAIERREAVTWDEERLTPYGKRFGEITINPVFDAAGICINAIGTVHDVTARIRAEEQRRKHATQLQEAERLRALGTLAGGIAHDFNNILTAIRGHTELALLESQGNASVRESLDEVRRASVRAADLVRQILTFGRHEKPQRELIDLRGIVEEALALLRSTLPAGIALKVDLSPRAQRVLADATQIHRVVMNLGTNARQAMEARGGELRIAIEEVSLDGDAALAKALAPGQYARLQVADQGSGMSEETLSRVFEPFFTTKGSKGTGLGLSVVHGIMKSHMGAVAISSRLGHGTTFDLYFPVVTSPVVSTASADSRPPAQPRAHVLYVDDDEALVLLCSRLLRKLGYRVTGKTDSAEALAAFRADPNAFDAVIVDVGMPKLSGPELMREVKRLRPEVSATLVSGYVAEPKLDDVLLKPTTAQELARLLDRMLSDGSRAPALGK
jgi:PAS domain S-box-containing protein